MANARFKVSLNPKNFHDDSNGKAQHTHIPQIDNTTASRTEVVGGGRVVCGVCGLVLMAPDT